MERDLIWRYLSTDKFDKLISDNGIYFSKASDFEDKKEGYYTHKKKYEELREREPYNIEAINKAEEMSNRIRDREPLNNYISCWHKNEKENIEMWHNYIENPNEGVVIKSHIYKIIFAHPESLSEVITWHDCEYGDKDNNDDYTENFKYKDYIFSYENEFRLIINSHLLNILTPFQGGLELVTCIGNKPAYEVLGNGKDPKKDIHKKGNGFVVKYNLNKIIDEIRVSPKSSDEYLMHIKRKMQDAGLTCPLNQSELKNMI
ncbi:MULTISPECIES: hypothetical protein [Pectobacterium]|uniref:DUF2971 domain-containing protein n=1 Tax=Pectobacterium polonicum TaxID=2485124 RepID=A0AAE9NRM1_9GAMM|nr:hypothetical protein [Pectobacterium polonicum]UVO09319.1 hypothetical protein LW347_04915 [Pectobacterium polonicum]GKW03826.1 hypothetical protein PEC301877_26390 [Pectobacterium carotovorum subsp. carotovorum]